MKLSLGEKIMILRKKHKISQRQFAEILGISHANFPNYESNRYKPSLEMLVKIADYFNVSLDSLVRDEVNDASFIIQDREILELAKKMDSLPEKGKAFLKNTIVNFLESNS